MERHLCLRETSAYCREAQRADGRRRRFPSTGRRACFGLAVALSLIASLLLAAGGQRGLAMAFLFAAAFIHAAASEAGGSGKSAEMVSRAKEVLRPEDIALLPLGPGDAPSADAASLDFDISL